MHNNTPKKKVLLVEDNSAVAALFREWFTDLFPESDIKTIHDFEECLAETKKTQPDVIIIDINLPGINGPGAIRRMKENGINTKVIILTSFSELDTLKPDLLKFRNHRGIVNLPPSLNFSLKNTEEKINV